MIRILTVAFTIIVINVVSISAQTNYSLYSLDDVFPICISEKESLIYGVSWEEDVMVINSYNIRNGKKENVFSEGLPKNPIKLMLAHPKKDILYLVTARKINETGIRYIDQIYELNTKQGKVKSIAKVYYDYLIPNKIGLVDNSLILTTLQKPTYVFDLKIKSFRLLNPNIHYQLLSIAPEQEGFLMLNVNETYNGHVSVHFMNMDNEITGVIGYLNNNVTINSEKRNLQLATITLVDSTYDWIAEPIRYNCFPLNNFELSMRPFWLKNAVVLDKAYEILGIAAADKSYLITKSGKSSYVYNYELPNPDSTNVITESDITNIQNYIDKGGSYERSVISSKEVDAVFDAIFYMVYKDNRFKYVAAQYYGTYTKLNDYNNLVSMIQPDFKLLNDGDAKKLQDALNVVFPVDTFNKKELKYETVDGGWNFIRGSAFGNYYGIFVSADEVGNVLKIEYKSEL